MQKKLKKNEFSFPDQENVKLTGSRRTASARAGGTSISTFSCARKFIFSHMKMFGGGALLQNGEL